MNKNYNIYRCIIVIVILLCFYYILTGEINESFVSFNEKVKYRMLSKSFNSPKWVKYIDKLKFKEYARKKNVDTPKTLGIFSNPYEIKYDDIPNNCVIKLNNGSGRNIIIKDKTIIGGNLPKNLDLKNDWHIIQNKLNYWKKPYNPKREQQYKYITPLIYFEELLEPEPVEYKLHVFNGKVKIIYLADNKVVGSCRRYYDVNWNYIGCYDNIYKECNYEIKKPKNLKNIIKIDELLSDNIDYVRIDLFVKNNKIYGGEFTLTPGAGNEKISPEKCDRLLSSYWNL